MALQIAWRLGVSEFLASVGWLAGWVTTQKVLSDYTEKLLFRESIII